MDDDKIETSTDDDEFTSCGRSHSFCTTGGGACRLREGHATDHVCDKCGKTF